MARFDEFDEQAQQQWYARFARKRLDLSASVEETLLDASLQEDQEEDEAVHPVLPSNDAALIPPRLSLQSKPLPVVHPDAPPEHLTSSESSGASLSPALHTSVGKIQSFPKIEGVLPVSPAEYTLPAKYTGSHKPLLHRVVEATAALPKLSIRRTTKVRLQVVPKIEEAQPAEEMYPSRHEATTNPGLPAVQQQQEQPARLITEPHRAMSGSGTFERGQCDLAVANQHITASSVVVVVLTGDPGPVVVQYISLQPQVGFTVHLSAATRNTTPFNYTIL